ncbi:MAG: RNA recognition motif domain-containing protein [Bryobacteraceae bacterium]
MKNLFVGNLDFSTTENEVRSLFEGYGAVDRVSIVTDRDTGRSRGFGFVEMAANAEAEAAIAELDGREWRGRALKVNEALPKGEGARGKRPGGGGGGGGHSRQRREPRW